MRAVWSLRAAAGRATGWADERAHLLAWVLSVMTARAHYDAAVLVTDTRGRAVLAGALELPFDEVRTDLDDAPPAVPARPWAIAAQTVPFVHLDPDVFLWQPLPPAVSRGPIFAQNPIRATSDERQATNDEQAILRSPAPFFPDAWPPAVRWAATGGQAGGIDLSFLGANFLGFIHAYAGGAMRFFEGAPAHAAGLSDATEGALLAAYLAYYRGQTEAGSALEIAYLFESAESAAAGPRAEAVGYTRLGAAGRADADLALRIERRVAHDYPDYYRRCLRLLATWRGW